MVESITKSQKDDLEDIDDMISESDEKFIVPDGYLSEEEVSDKEELKQQNNTNNNGQYSPQPKPDQVQLYQHTYLNDSEGSQKFLQ